jgi:hypothetical protein
MARISVRRGGRDFLVFLGTDGRVTSIRVRRAGKWLGYWQSWTPRPMRPCERAVAALAIESGTSP